MSLTKLEQETIVIFNEEEPWATISTTSTLVIARLNRAGYPGSMDGVTFTAQIPKSLVRLRGPGWKSLRLAGSTATVASQLEVSQDQ